MRRAARTDKTHASIRDELREAGFSVADTSALGKSFPDLVAGKHGINILIECKTPRGRKTALERFSEDQTEFRAAWRGGQPIPAYCTQDVLDAFRLMVKRVGWSA